MFSLAGKACVVTGASRGLGRAIALAFADRGADVTLGARSRVDLETVAREIQAKGRRAVVQPTDVTDFGQIRALADAAVAGSAGSTSGSTTRGASRRSRAARPSGSTSPRRDGRPWCG